MDVARWQAGSNQGWRICAQQPLEEMIVQTWKASIAAVLMAVSGLAGFARAQDTDVDFVRDQVSATPNVMVLFDTSVSMYNMTWVSSFDPKVFQDRPLSLPSRSCTNLQTVPGTTAPVNYNGTAYYSGSPDYAQAGFHEVDGTATWDVSCPDNKFTNADCNAWKATFGSTTCSYSSVTKRYTFKFVDVDPTANKTSWSHNYVHYLLNTLASTHALPSGFQKETRVMAGKRAIQTVINDVNPNNDATDRVRFGLGRFKIAVSFFGASSQGGYVFVPVGYNNKPALTSGLSALVADDLGTPLAGALIDIARYFTGSFNSLGGSGGYSQYRKSTSGADPSSTYPASPIDPNALCRGNFVVYVTDGEPESDDNLNASAYNKAFQGKPYALSSVTSVLANTDLIPSLTGNQVIPTYAVGFSLDSATLQDAARQGDGAYYTANDADALAMALSSAIEEIILRAATFATASVPSSRTSANSAFFRAYFKPKSRGLMYEGHLQAYTIGNGFTILGRNGVPATDPVTGEFLDTVPPIWDAQTVLHDPNSPRTLLVNAGSGVFDTSNAALTAAALGVTSADVGKYINDPSTAPLTTTAQTTTALIKYMRGEDSLDEDHDGRLTELRDSMLGDIFHSDPLALGPASLFLASESGFGPVNDPNSFYGQNRLRNRVLYTGANDGFLHAFEAGALVDPDATRIGDEYYTIGTGKERFGYIPAFLLPRVRELGRADLPKPFFVDGAPSASDAWIPATLSSSIGPNYRKQASEWGTVLVNGMRSGGEGYLALDVTKAGGASQTVSGAYPRLLWQFTHANLGRSWSKPVITRVKLRAGSGGDFCGTNDGDGNCIETWVAIFAAGYQSTGDPSITGFTGGLTKSSGIFMVELRTGALLATAPGGGCSMPTEPSVIDIDFDGFADVVYAGDLCGKMFKWDLKQVGVRTGGSTTPVGNWPSGAFFVSPPAANGHKRSFFNPPSAAFISGHLTLAFGSGERTNLSYATTSGDENHFYVIRDEVPTGAGAIPSTPHTPSELTLLNTKQRDTNPSDLGFYLVGRPHEKFVTETTALGGKVIMASYVSDPTAPRGNCAPRGQGSLYVLSLENGEGSFKDTDPDRARRMALSVASR
jgi:type IV pilus assembly protein PilY1